MNWPRFVYELAELFDKSPFFKAALVLVVFGKIIYGLVFATVLIVALIWGFLETLK